MRMKCLGVPYLLLLIGLPWPAIAGDPFDIWHWRNPEPSGNRLHGVTHGNGRYVAVGDAGVVMMSEDSRNWSAAAVPVGSALHGVTFGNNRFVAVGESGTVISSGDGIVWQRENLDSWVHLNDVAWGEGVFVAVGVSGAILTSADGANWTLQTIGGDDLRAIAYGDGRFVAVGGYPGAGSSLNNPPPRPLLLVSEDGVSWSSRRSASARHLTGVVHGDGRWLTVSQSGVVNVSYDTESWLPTDVGIGLAGAYQLAFGAGRYVLVGGSSNTSLGRVWSSADGFVWSAHALTSFANPSEDITFGDSGFAAVGGQWRNTAQNVLRSTDGLVWDVLPFDWRDMRGWATFAGGYFFIKTSRHQYPFSSAWETPGSDAWISASGQEWQRVTLSSSADLNALAWGNGNYVTVGAGGTAAVSPNGREWETIVTAITNDLHAIANGSGLFIAVGAAGAVLASPDGRTWSEQSSGSTNALKAVAWNGRFVAAEPADYDFNSQSFLSGAVLTSTDGLSWSRQVLPAGQSLQNVTPWGTGFAGIVSGRAAVSEDGINWIQSGPTASAFNPVSPIFAVDGMLAWVPDYTAATLAVSSDGTNWSARPLPWPPSIHNFYFTGLTGGNGTFLVGDGNGNVAQSEPVLPRPPSINGPPSIRFGGPGRETTLEVRVSGSSPFSFQWRRDGVDIGGATNRLLQLAADEPAGHWYSVEVTNDNGTAGSDAIALTEPLTPEVAIEFDRVFSFVVRGSIGRRHILEMTDRLSTEGGEQRWTEAASFRIESDDEARILPWSLISPENAYFRVRVEP